MSKLSFRDHLCKGCGLCVAACPKHLLSLDTSRLNQKGFHPAHIEVQDACIAGAICASVCPDVVIKVEK